MLHIVFLSSKTGKIDSLGQKLILISESQYSVKA